MGYWPVVKKVINESDIVLFILDGRMPEMSKNSVLEDMVRKERKALLLVFTKMDLVNRNESEKLREKFKDAFFVSGAKNIGMKRLKAGILIKAQQMGLENPMIGVVGYPNVGKSAVINALAKRAKTKVSSQAGTTRGIQWINVGNLRVLDSPGVVPLKDSELKLGMLGAKNVEKMRKPEQVGFKIIRTLLSRNKGNFEKFYNINLDGSEDEYEILLKIGEARKFLQKGGKIDEQRTFHQIIRDWQSGKIII